MLQCARLTNQTYFNRQVETCPVPQRSSFFQDLLKLLLFLFFLPVIALLIGPTLVIAAILGRLRIGPLEFNPGQRGPGQRGFALIVGILLWLLIWAGLGWLWLSFAPKPIVSPAISRASVTVAITTPAGTTAVPRTTASPPASATPTETPLLPTPPPGVVPTPTEMAATVTLAPTATPHPSDTPRLLPSATPTATPTVAPVAPPPAGSLSAGDKAAALAAVDRANVLLAAAIASPSDGNLNNLASAWSGESLEQVQSFAQDVYDRYLQPLNVEFQYLDPPRIQEEADARTLVVVAREVWTYSGPNNSEREAFAFTYTLRRADAGWVVTDYRYLNITLPIPTLTPVP
ncbi:MAG: hypothetical protein ACE5H9_17525 [Anaerolineae bacterium]